MFSLFLLAFSFLLAVCATPHSLPHQIRHHDIAKRHTTDVNLHKRFSSARWTFYTVGLGACGKTNVKSDFIVALNSPQFGGGYPGPNCFKTITMTYNGITAQATIMDECPGCPYGGLDLSEGLFSHFGSLDLGVLYGTWTFSDGSGGGGDDKPTPKPTHSDPPPEPKTTSHTETSTKEEPTSTPAPKPKPTTTSEKPSTKTSSQSSTSTSSTTTTSSSSTSIDYTSDGLAVPTILPIPSSPQNLNNINSVVIQFGCLILAAGSVH